MPISWEEVQHVARLARLELDDHELREFQAQLNALLGHFQDLDRLELTGETASPHVVALHDVYDDDVPAPGLSREDALRNAFRTRAGLFLVPTIIED